MVGIRFFILVLFVLFLHPLDAEAVFMYKEKKLNEEGLASETMNEKMGKTSRKNKLQEKKKLLKQAREQRKKREETLTPFVSAPLLESPKKKERKKKEEYIQPQPVVVVEENPEERVDYEKMIVMNLFILVFWIIVAIVFIRSLFRPK